MHSFCPDCHGWTKITGAGRIGRHFVRRHGRKVKCASTGGYVSRAMVYEMRGRR